MKVYVVKNDKNEYMTQTGDFINSLWQAELFYDYECAYCYAPSCCNIVECSLMEKYQLTDYTKQVRKEVLSAVEKRIINYCRRQDKKPFQKSIEQIKVDLLTSIKQIQGETNE